MKLQKIAIIGCAGSGKSTLAKKLGSFLTLPVYHLDQYYWLPGWQRRSFEEFKLLHDEICDKPVWITDGPMVRLAAYRFKSADVIIYLRFSRWRCLWNVIKRYFKYYGKVREDSPYGCPEQLTFEFLRWVWNFNAKNDVLVMQNISAHFFKKPIYIFTSHKQVNEFLMLLEKAQHLDDIKNSY